MHFTEPVYRNPYWPTFPMLQITQGCTHNKCRFCSMYKGVAFKMEPLAQIEEDLKEIRSIDPHAKTIQLLSANPLALSFNNLKPRLELIRKYLPEIEHIYAQTRVTDILNKSVEEWKELRRLGVDEISLGVESGDDETLKMIDKGYTSKDIVEACRRLDEAGVRYWMTYFNGVGGRELSKQHALNSAKVFNQCHPMQVGTGGLVLFPDTPLHEDIAQGRFTPLDENGLMEELKIFLENLNVDCFLRTHHTSSLHLTGPFLPRKKQIVDALQYAIDNYDLDEMAVVRNSKITL